MRKIIFGLTILVVIFSGCKSKSYDFSAVCENGQTLYYKITSNEEPYKVEIVRQNINEPYYDINPIGNLVIPETVLYNGITYSVKEIGNNAFSNSHLVSVSLPKTITSIRDSAFYMCSGIREIVIPNTVTYVGRKAFYGCDSIESVALLYSDPDWLSSLKEDEKKCIYYRADDDGHDSYGSTIWMLESIFTKKTSQYKLVISNDITSIPDYAFKDCSIFSSVEIPNSVTSIGNSAFEDCYKLTSFSISTSVESIGNSAFKDCYNLTSFSIPASVTSIGNSAFEGTGWYRNQSDGIVYLDNWCLGYKSDTLIVGVIVADPTQQEAPTRGEDIIYRHAPNREKPIGTLTIQEGAKGIADGAFYYRTRLKSLIVPNSVKYIGKCAFDGCEGLTTVSIGESVEIIDSSAFRNCYSLKSLTLPNSVTCIGDDAFSCYPKYDNSGEIIDYGCNELKSLTIPNSVKSIGESAFSGRSRLTSVIIGNSVEIIGDGAFYNCSGLTSISVNTDNSFYDSRENCNAIIETATNTLISGCNNTIIPNSVNSIGDYAFYNCSGLSSVTIPDSVTEIREGVFYGCSGLTTVTFGSSVTSIGWCAFSGCSSLASVYYNGNVGNWCGISFDNVAANPLSCAHNLYMNNSLVRNLVIPNTVTEIKDNTFCGASCLTSVTIPTSVTKIDGYAFYGCSGLTSITIPNSVTNIDMRAFNDCRGLKDIEVDSCNPIYDSRDDCNAIIETSTNKLLIGCSNTVIPNSVTSIGNGAFRDCSGLISVTIPNSVTEIGSWAFASCVNLTKVIIPESVTKIADYAFYKCHRLKGKEIIPNKDNVSIGDNALDFSPIEVNHRSHGRLR